ncbi:hypothetical protein SAMN05421595_0174 [Austwickia chelonae]|nr:hypothetical protein [Austwickia chelonae]SEV87317.1 hypothetical protein SAMN05421595_0174 [Austwickia chelonae]
MSRPRGGLDLDVPASLRFLGESLGPDVMDVRVTTTTFEGICLGLLEEKG